MIDEATGADILAGGDGDETAAPPADGVTREWMASLPAELQADPTLGRYADVPALAHAHLEAHKHAKGKLAIPAADAPAEAWDPVWTALGRPDTPAGYDFGFDADAEATMPMVAPFREFAHKTGMPAGMAKAVVEFNNAQQQAAIDADAQTLAAFKSEKGTEYPAIEASAVAAFKAMGLDAEFAERLSRMTSSGAMIKGFAQIADLIGEHKRIAPDDDPALLNGVPDDQAEAKLTTLQKSSEWRTKLLDKDPLVVAERDRLMAAAKRHAGKG